MEPDALKSLKRYAREFTLAAGDEIEVDVYRYPEVSRVQAIRGDGFISLPLLDDIQAANLTIRQLDDRITGLLNKRLINPEVTIIVKNAVEPMAYVMGDVGFVKPVSIREARTVAQAIARVGGLNRSASRKHIALIRLDENGFLRSYTADQIMSGQPGMYMALQNMPLQADDLVVVPEGRRSQATRWLKDFVTSPLQALNQILNPYFQYKLIEEIQQ